MSLAKVGEIVRDAKHPKPEYLGKRSYETMDEKQSFVKYAMADARIVYKAMKLMQQNLNGYMGITLASSSLKFYRNTFNDFQWKMPDWVNEYVKRSFFGGRVEAFYRGKIESSNFGDIKCYDFNSLYPSVMLMSMPDISQYPKILKGSYDSDALGCVTATIKSDCMIPILPSREDKLKFKCGVQTGCYSIPELNEMVSRGEGKILSIDKSFNWKKTDSYFKDYVKHFYDARLQMIKEHNPNEKIMKLLMNALYGKWAEIIEPIEYVSLKNVKDTSKITQMLDDNFCLIKGEKQFTKHTFFPIASTITAYARLKLHDALHRAQEQKHKEVFYCDTDSIYTNATMNTSDLLGDLKLEKTEKDWILFLRAKAYLTSSYLKLKGAGAGLEPGEKVTSNEVVACLEQDKDIEIIKSRFIRFRESNKRIDKCHLEVERRMKSFSTFADGKRDYFKDLSSKQLLNNFSASAPLNYLS
jgi:hypothetical protein